MATVTCKWTVIDSDGKTVDSKPSTNKTFAKQIASRQAKKIGGTYRVDPIEPVEYRPEDWQ